MNAAFRGAAAQFRAPRVKLTHAQEVCRLYRQSLKCLYSWTFNRDLFNEEASKLRARFESNKNLPVDGP